MAERGMRRRTFLKASVLAGGATLGRGAVRLARAAALRRLSILFCSPQGLGAGWIDLEYLQELHAHGFEVDYTNQLGEVTWPRIRQYNVLVLYITPDSYAVTLENQPSSPVRVRNFVQLIDRYVAAGGGVFLMPMEQNMVRQKLAGLTGPWGARLPLETIVETDPTKQGYLLHAPNVPLAYTDLIPHSPVSEGIQGIWYPTSPHYYAADTGPIVVDGNWQVVVRASATAHSQPEDLKKLSQYELPPHAFARPAPVSSPAWLAIRPYQAGRIALVNQWPQYSVGSGVKWIFDRQVLTRGFGSKPSDFGRLLENIWRWLAEPSLKHKSVGGYVTSRETLVAPNLLPAARRPYEYGQAYWQAKLAQWHQPPRFAPVFRGLIGAKTAYSSGSGTVAQYAQAAKKADLQFIVFLEDFDQLTREKWARLKADCQRLSDDGLTLLPGYTIDANTGDHMFFFGPVAEGNDPWPPAQVLTGPDKTLLDLQPRNKDGKFTGYNGPSFDWMLYSWDEVKGNHGYYHFSGHPQLMRISDLRVYAMAAIRYYRDGRLVEDNTADYLTCAACTIPPAPVSFNEVRSPAELAREVERGHALTYVQAPWYVPKPSVRKIFYYGLWWADQYTSYNTFPSDGPIIHAWPETYRVWTLGAEEFVTRPNIMVSRLEVSAAAGLKEIALYNGPELFRRFLPNGAKTFSQTLLLNASNQRDLVLIATDGKGGQAISFARRCWKDGTLAPTFCSDHVNSYSEYIVFAHGPNPMVVTRAEPLPQDIAGVTWDGGPPPSIPLVAFGESRPTLVTDQGQEVGSRFENTPLLDYADEGSAGLASRQDRVFADSVLQVLNPWNTFGPLAGPGKLMEFTLQYWECLPPTVGVPQTGWAVPGVREGINACLFRSEVRFKRDCTVQQLTLLQNDYWLPPGVKPVRLVLGKAPGVVRQEVHYFPGAQSPRSGRFHLAPGDWFALYSPQIACSHIFVVRQQPIQLRAEYPLITIAADMAGKRVQAGERYSFELFSLGVPVNIGLKNQTDVTRLLGYLHQPEGMKVVRGQRVASPGFIECAAANGAVEALVPKPSWKTNLTLPLRVRGLNRRWSAGLFQKSGYVLGHYGTGENRYRTLGVDQLGYAYVPMYVDRAEVTHMVAGHPVIADAAGKDLFIGVMHLRDKPAQWCVSVNNPTDQPITSLLHQAMDLPGFIFPDTKITLQPGEYRVVG